VPGRALRDVHRRDHERHRDRCRLRRVMPALSRRQAVRRRWRLREWVLYRDMSALHGGSKQL
jgi:hypothetical protein